MNNTLFPDPQIAQRLLAAELSALTVKTLFPGCGLMGGGLHSLGFYYDFILDQALTESMQELIEVHLHRLIREEHSIRFMSMMRENAQALFRHHHQNLLAEKAGESSSNILEVIQVGDYYGLCPTLSLSSTSDAGHVKFIECFTYLRDVHGEEVVVTRLIGTTQNTAKDLKIFLKKYHAFLKKRDHRSWGVALNLFSFSSKIGDLGVLWHPKGFQLRKILQQWVDNQCVTEEYQISTPSTVLEDFLPTDSLVLDPFYFEGRDYRLRPSLTRSHIEYFRTSTIDATLSPFRVSEEAMIYRHYPEFQWWGLLCSCSYTTQQTTIYCSKQHVLSELSASILFIEKIMRTFAFEGYWRLVTSPYRSQNGRQEQEAIAWLKQAISQERYFSFSDAIEEDMDAEGARLEFIIQDELGRDWPLSNVGIPRYGHKSAKKEQEATLPGIFITRQLWNSLDRLIALLIEKNEGSLPFWLIPEQVRILPIGEANVEYAEKVQSVLVQNGVRSRVEKNQSRLNMRVLEAEKERVPYLLLLGEQERNKQKISVRESGTGRQTQGLELDEFLQKIQKDLHS